MRVVSMARSKYLRCPPRRWVGLAFQPAMASGDSQRVMLPRSTSERSSSDQLATRYSVFNFGGRVTVWWASFTYRQGVIGPKRSRGPMPVDMAGAPHARMGSIDRLTKRFMHQRPATPHVAP